MLILYLEFICKIKHACNEKCLGCHVFEKILSGGVLGWVVLVALKSISVAEA